MATQDRYEANKWQAVHVSAEEGVEAPTQPLLVLVG